MNISDLLKTPPTTIISNHKNTSSYLKNELFKAGLYQKEEEFNYLLSVTDSLWTEFLFSYQTEKDPDKYASIVHAGCEWFKENYAIKLVEKALSETSLLYYEKNRDDLIGVCINHQKLSVIELLLDKNFINKDNLLNYVILVNPNSKTILEKLTPETVFKYWDICKDRSIENQGRIDSYEFFSSVSAIVSIWSNKEFNERQSLMPEILSRMMFFNPSRFGNIGDALAKMVLNKFIPLDFPVQFEENGVKKTVKQHIEERKLMNFHDELDIQYENASKEFYKEKLEGSLFPKKASVKKMKI